VRANPLRSPGKKKDDEKAMGDTLEMKMLIIQKHDDK
jgi:hypothetical protein